MEDRYYIEAKKIYEERKAREIEKIAEQLKERDLADKLQLKQLRCSHNKIFSYNHGYHKICEDCGLEL